MTMTDHKQIAIYISGINVETFDKLDEPTADSDGHVIHATILKHDGPTGNLVPVKIRIDHGVAPATAAAMLRKAADMIEKTPDMLSADPGTAIRRLPDGSSVRKLLTPAKLLEAGRLLDEEDRKRLIDLVERLRDDLPPDDDDTPGDATITGPGLG
ncbi:MAG: hypothetical protein R3B57_11065 [Phycisphaerales bacterium]